MLAPGKAQDWAGGNSVAKRLSPQKKHSSALLDPSALRGSHRVVLDKPEYVKLLERIARDGVAPVSSKTVRGFFRLDDLRQLRDKGVLFAATDRKLGQSLIGINPMLQEVGLACNLEMRKPSPESLKKTDTERGRQRPRCIFHIL